MNDQTIGSPGKWVIIDVVNGTRKLVMRQRTDRPADRNIDSYSTAVVIQWVYPEQEGTAKPPDAEWNRMERFEDAISDLMWERGCSYLMNISTGLGMREWCFYARNRDDFMKRFNAALASHQRYPVEIKFYDDPEWKVWLDLRYAYERSGGEHAAPIGPSLPRGLISRIGSWFRRSN